MFASFIPTLASLRDSDLWGFLVFIATGNLARRRVVTAWTEPELMAPHSSHRDS